MRVVLVDDKAHYRKALHFVLTANTDFEIVGEYDNGQDFLDQLYELQPDLVLMDIKMPVMDGIEATKRAINQDRHIKIIGLTLFEDRTQFLGMLEAGAKGVVPKSAGELELKEAIQSVISGKYFYSKKLVSTILR